MTHVPNLEALETLDRECAEGAARGFTASLADPRTRVDAESAYLALTIAGDAFCRGAPVPAELAAWCRALPRWAVLQAGCDLMREVERPTDREDAENALLRAYGFLAAALVYGLVSEPHEQTPADELSSAQLLYRELDSRCEALKDRLDEMRYR